MAITYGLHGKHSRVFVDEIPILLNFIFQLYKHIFDITYQYTYIIT